MRYELLSMPEEDSYGRWSLIDTKWYTEEIENEGWISLLDVLSPSHSKNSSSYVLSWKRNSSTRKLCVAKNILTVKDLSLAQLYTWNKRGYALVVDVLQ
nr:hypothetical protein Iba_chr11bCG9200 [Ipomoea batatas]